MAELQETMSAAEFAEWLAFDRLSPIGGERGDVHAGAVVQATLAGTTGQSHSLADCMPQYKPPGTTEEREAKKWQALTAMAAARYGS